MSIGEKATEEIAELLVKYVPRETINQFIRDLETISGSRKLVMEVKRVGSNITGEMTKLNFMSAYRKLLIERYDWAKDEEKLTKFMKSVHDTLYDGRKSSWDYKGEMTKRAWHQIGGVGTPTLVKLRYLK